MGWIDVVGLHDPHDLVEGVAHEAGADAPPGARSTGRTFADAPDIDCRVFLEEDLPSGEIVTARIEGVFGYDLLVSPESRGSRA